MSEEQLKAAETEATAQVEEGVDEISEEINRYELGQAGIDNDDDYEEDEYDDEE